MSSLVVCPDCKKQLKVPETMMGKAFRCPACKAVISSLSKSRSTASDSESDEPDTPSPSRAMKKTPSSRSASVPSRSRPPREEEREDDLEVVDEKPSRAKSSRKRRPTRKKSSTGLIIGLVAGGVGLLLVLAVGGGLAWYFLRNTTIPEAEWQTFTPPGGNCTVLMPGTPVPQSVNMLNIQSTQYTIVRDNGKKILGVAFCDIPPQTIIRPSLLEEVAGSSRNHAMDAMGGGKVTSDTAISLGNIPGREFQIKPATTRGILIGRIYLTKVGGRHRIYLIMVGGDFIQPNKGDAARFFDSFKLDASASPPTFAGPAGEGAAQPPLAQPPANPQPNVPPGIPGSRFPRRTRP